jgi:hypothetical protein
VTDDNRWVHNVDEFLKLIVDSGLIGADNLRELHQDFESDVLRASPFGNTIAGLTSYLVSKGVLTCWQVDRLRAGRYKGFFYFGFRLLDRLGDSSRGSTYLAEHEATGELVAIEVIPAVIGKKFAPPRVIQTFEN